MNNTKTGKSKMILSIIVVVVAVLAGFFIGLGVGSSNNTKSANSQFAAAGQGTKGGFSRGTGSSSRGSFGGSVSGQILSVDANGITVGLTSGGSKIVIIPQSANILKSTQGTSGDLSVGSNVTIQGSTNTDGSVTAQMIQIRPAMPARPSASSTNQ